MLGEQGAAGELALGLVEVDAAGAVRRRPSAVYFGPPTSGAPNVITCDTWSGSWRASSRATIPPRLQPTSATGRSCDPLQSRGAGA